MSNPFITVHGPRPERWWVTCDLCGKASQPRFASVAEAEEWEHDCRTEADGDDGTVTVTVVVSVDDPPKVSWEGTLTSERRGEAEQALRDMGVWTSLAASKYRTYEGTWQDYVRDSWVRHREQAKAKLLAQFEEAVKRPFVCPGCGERYMKAGGLKRHMAACYRIDPFKLKRGEYDTLMVPGAAIPSKRGTE